MVSIRSLMHALSERMTAQEIGIPHDEARIQYRLNSNTVRSFEEFSDVMADYYVHHYSLCVAIGARFTRGEATSRAKEILTREYRRRNGDIVTAYNDAKDGTNGGLRSLCDMIADALKAESVERYVRDVFDRHVAPNSWEDQVEIIRQFIAECGTLLSANIRTDQPERYARNYEELIRAYVESLKRTSPIFRRL
ncbi:MAG: hypothetical protein V2A74_10125 [bacterium]